MTLIVPACLSVGLAVMFRLVWVPVLSLSQVAQFYVAGAIVAVSAWVLIR